MTDTTAASARAYASDPADPLKGRFSSQLGYLLSGLPVGIVALLVSVAGFSLGVSTLIIWIGMPLLFGALAAARAFARLERRWVARATGRPVELPHYRPVAGHGPKRWLNALRDPQSWRDLIHMVASFPVRVASFCVTLTWTVGGLGGLSYGLWSWSIPRDGESGVLDLAFDIDSAAADIAFNTGVGVVLLATAVPVIRGLTVLQASLSRALLGKPTVY